MILDRFHAGVSIEVGRQGDQIFRMQADNRGLSPITHDYSCPRLLIFHSYLTTPSTFVAVSSPYHFDPLSYVRKKIITNLSALSGKDDILQLWHIEVKVS